ncbi:alpha/beta hydrolase [Roseobacter sp.]|uniref:alpha/beta hydrolase n=1 Tax=Roseobacter sp. TaxID=1907202 RepID=UPI003299FCEB
MRPYFAIAMTLAVIAVSFGVLGLARQGVTVTQTHVGATPVTSYQAGHADGPVVVMAHGFAGSQQMMQGYALTLARAGYRVFVYEFEGHGRHPLPMSGDVSQIDGTTRLLMHQTRAVLDAVAIKGAPTALLGHSVATDILVRSAADRQDIGPVVLISAFSQAITPQTPTDLLLITGAWEPGLRAFGLDAVQMVTPDATEGQTAVGDGVSRRTVVAPFAEHVSVLHSRVGRQAALQWLDQSYGRSSDITIWPTGWAILGVLAGVVVLFRPIAATLPCAPARTQLRPRQLTWVILVPAVITPLIAVPIPLDLLPVLVADYLALHLLIFGAVQLAFLRYWRVGLGPGSRRAFGLTLLWCALFGGALNQYAANFWPTSGRAWIIAAMMVGTLPYMLADTALTAQASLVRRVFIRAGFLVSLGGAVALDFDALFFLVMIAPVLVLFYLAFGTMGRFVSARAGPVAPGIALGLVLAWALGVSFPLFQP